MSSVADQATHRRHWVIAWGLIFCASTQSVAFAPLYPLLRGSWGLAGGHLSTLMGAYALAYALATLVAGRLLQRYEPGALLTVGGLSLASSLLLLPLAQSLPTLLALRLLAAGSHALLLPAIVNLIEQNQPSAQAYRVTGWILSGHASAHLIGSPLLLLLSTGAIGPLGALALTSLGLLPAWLWRRARRPSGTGARPTEVPSLAAWGSIWRRQSPRFFLLGTFLASAGANTVVLFFPLHFIEQLDRAPAQLVPWLIAGGVGQCLGMPLGGQAAARWGARPVILASMAASIALLLLASLAPVSLALGLAAVALATFSGLRAAPLQIGFLHGLEAAERPIGASLVSALNQAGRAGGAVLGLTYWTPLGSFALLLTAVLLFAIAAVLFVAARLPNGFSPSREEGKEPALARGLQDEDVQKTPGNLATKAD